MKKHIFTPIEFLDDKFVNLVYNDYIDGFSVREITWRINQTGFNNTVDEINEIIDEINSHLL